MDVFREFSDTIHYFVKNNFANGIVLAFQIFFKFLFLLIIFLVLDLFLKFVTNMISRLVVNISKNDFLKSAYRARVQNAVTHLLVVIFCLFIVESVFYRHPRSFEYINRLLGFMQVIFCAILAYRLVKALENFYIFKEDHYRITAIKAISETLKIFGIVIFSFVALAVIFGIKAGTILGSISAVTAIILLVFRDTILGFMTGIHVSLSKNLKVGDWIGVPKYSIEGNIQEINLLTTKIQNFDKTISTIPTYDLLSTEIRNHQIMFEGSRRRIKRSVFFNIKSFKFVDDEFYQKVKDINLISEYLDRKLREIEESKKNIPHAERIINGQQLTNIGLFRNYVKNYLEKNSKIDHDEIILVRQLEISPQGLPLEIYCFANKAEMIDYERIQADIFDHILTASKEFDLEVMQVSKA